MTMREKTVERYLVNECDKRGWRAFKFVSPGQRDVPDRLIAVRGSLVRGRPGQLVLCEVKRPGGKLRKGQARMRDELEAMDIKVYVVDTFDEVDAMLEELARG